ncbi:hypothetical protein PXH66_05050 [Synoicihabitans lomoniglobus]|uniref:Uncharacterized protein n=2 Tax=Synoicihabitans lomoniglobus TaxID=2909285 RepID=A0AAF0CQI5_9BACT|nr:hypothetical protein PXH66_05050 [Opitutaceae bacterium LMO-M01]
MKLTATLLIAALVAPAALAFGLSAAIVSTAATGTAIAAIALGDYGSKACTYADTTVTAPRTERHPLAA